MRILIIGGTKFSGRHLVKAALNKNHTVTIFHRGNHPAADIGDVEEILGDRIFDLDKLENREWDVVIDMCGYLPQWVNSSAAFLENSVEKYVLISSVSAYGDFSTPNFDENAPLARLTPEQEERFEKIDPQGDFVATSLGDLYGPLKVLCEEEAQDAFRENHLIIRPGLIVGEYDFTDRFTYWVMRIADGGEVLAPANPNAFVQFIDAKDLAEWLIHLIESDETGIYNAVNRPFEMTFKDMLEEIGKAVDTKPKLTWVSDDFLTENEVAAWTEMPLHIPGSGEGEGDLRTANADQAFNKGLKIRSFSETVSDTFTWRKKLNQDMRSGISRKRESDLLRKWHEQT